VESARAPTQAGEPRRRAAEQDKLLEMAVRAQHAGGSFWRVSWSIATLGALVALSFDTQFSNAALALIVFICVISWGWLLGRLGSRGWLPFPEEE
jgi:hypothetical protein